ncbi:MAG: protein translocase subunit SecF [Limnochordaceae bacterium]|nr:protein translocase subunit SecF [Limnochordaceae bacterium]
MSQTGNAATAAAQTMTAGGHFDVMARKGYFFGLSGILFVAAIIVLVWRGFNYGIDFTGGTLLERSFPQPVTVSELRTELSRGELAHLGLANAQIQLSTNGKNAIIRAKELSTDDIQKIDAALKARFGAVTDVRTEVIGPVVGSELLRMTYWSIFLGALGILLYISLRFEYRFATAGVIALLHDAVITMGIVALVQREINMPFVAAMLTILGYSINDTIVVFDRIRERLRLHTGESPAQVANVAILQTMNRSVNTSLTTLLAIAALYYLGGPTIKDFSLALLVGVIFGTYSSIFIASPIWVIWREWSERRRRGRSGRQVQAA